MTLPEGYKILAESRTYILGKVYEYGSIIDKRSGKEIDIGDSYGEPEFGLIDKNEKWALLFGQDSYLWTESEIIYLNDEIFVYKEVFENPFDARQTNDFEVEILDDPWSDNPSVFKFDIKTKKLRNLGLLKS